MSKLFDIVWSTEKEIDNPGCLSSVSFSLFVPQRRSLIYTEEALRYHDIPFTKIKKRASTELIGSTRDFSYNAKFSLFRFIYSCTISSQTLSLEELEKLPVCNVLTTR